MWLNLVKFTQMWLNRPRPNAIGLAVWFFGAIRLAHFLKLILVPLTAVRCRWVPMGAAGIGARLTAKFHAIRLFFRAVSLDHSPPIMVKFRLVSLLADASHSCSGD